MGIGMNQTSAKNFFDSRFWLALISGVLCLGLALGCYFLFTARQSVERRLDSMKSLLSKAETAAMQLKKEKEIILREKEKIQAETLKYMTRNNDLEKEREDLASRLKRVDGLIGTNKNEITKIQTDMDAQIKRILLHREKEQKVLRLQRQRLLESVRKHEETIEKERSLYHYDLGVAYAKAGFMRDSMREYEEAIKSDGTNADAHYNLALMYKNVEANYNRAALHFRRYLELRPDAEDAVWVQETINRMYDLDLGSDARKDRKQRTADDNKK